MKNAFRFLIISTTIIGCKGSSTEPTEKETRAYTCVLCDEYQAVQRRIDTEADEAGCDAVSEFFEAGTHCTVDGEHYSRGHYNLENCHSDPPCVADSLSGEGGSASDIEWDFECHICGGESEIDSAHDNGFENARCSDSGILIDVGNTCPSGERATLVGFMECEGIPDCAQ